MSRTLTALFDCRADAEAAKERLKAASIDISHVHVQDQGSPGYSASGDYSSQDNPGFWANVKNAFLPDEDRHTYEEGVRRGGALLTAEVDEDDADKAVAILDEANSVDLDQRASEWRSKGWDRTPPVAGQRSAFSAEEAAGERSSADVGEERIPIMEEQLKVGKREVSRGGVRVRSYVCETPVHEEISLRDERVSVERRPVDEAVSGAGDAFRERTVEMTETSEEAVVAKEARVREELVVKKDVGERVEQIDDTVRRTEVDVEKIGGESRSSTETRGRESRD